MKKNDYLFAVASVRAKENSLLKQGDLEQLINIEDYKKAVLFLNEKGYELPETSEYSKVLDDELEATWNYIYSAAPEAEALRALIVKNDFQNLKDILKAEIIRESADKHFVKPSVIEPEKLKEAVSKRDFSELPEFIFAPAQKALEIITTTGSGQLCDAVLDKGALEAIIYFASLDGDNVLKEFAEEYVSCADIKTAYRAVKTGKNSVFISSSVAKTSKLDVDSLVSSASEGMEGFLEYLVSAGFSDYKDALDVGASAFEKYCDDKILSVIKKAKMTAFGASPLAAYFIAKETELKCIRIILSAKLSRVSGEIIRERMRELYV